MLKVEPVEKATINLKGWRITSDSGAVIAGFTTKAEAERLIRWFNDELNWHVNNVMNR